MPSVTLRDVPDELHEKLMRRAVENGHTLDAEIIRTLEQSTVEPIRLMSMEEFLEHARRFRERVKFKTTDEEISRFKREGRP